jgi:hypothetical protein
MRQAANREPELLAQVACGKSSLALTTVKLCQPGSLGISASADFLQYSLRVCFLLVSSIR